MKEIITWKEDTRHLVTWCPVMLRQGQPKKDVMKGYGVGTTKLAVYLDFKDAILRYGKTELGKQGNTNATQEEIIKSG
jgi:hypothetical protein